MSRGDPPHKGHEVHSIQLRLTRLEEDVAALHGCLPSARLRISSALRPSTDRWFSLSPRKPGLAEDGRCLQSGQPAGHSVQDDKGDATALWQQLEKDQAYWCGEVAGLQMRVATLEQRSQDDWLAFVKTAEDQVRRTSALACDSIDEAARRRLEQVVEEIRTHCGKEMEHLLLLQQHSRHSTCEAGCASPTLSTTAADVSELLGPVEMRLSTRVEELEATLRGRCNMLDSRMETLDEAVRSAAAAATAAVRGPDPELEQRLVALAASEACTVCQTGLETWRKELARLDAEMIRVASRFDDMQCRIEESACRSEIERLSLTREFAGDERRPADTEIAEEQRQLGAISLKVVQLDGAMGRLRGDVGHEAGKSCGKITPEITEEQIREFGLLSERVAQVDSGLGALRTAFSQELRESGLLVEKLSQLDDELGALRLRCSEAHTEALSARELLKREGLQREAMRCELDELQTLCRATWADVKDAHGAMHQRAKELQTICGEVCAESQAASMALQKAIKDRQQGGAKPEEAAVTGASAPEGGATARTAQLGFEGGPFGALRHDLDRLTLAGASTERRLAVVQLQVEALAAEQTVQGAGLAEGPGHAGEEGHKDYAKSTGPKPLMDRTGAIMATCKSAESGGSVVSGVAVQPSKLAEVGSRPTGSVAITSDATFTAGITPRTPKLRSCRSRICIGPPAPASAVMAVAGPAAAPLMVAGPAAAPPPTSAKPELLFKQPAADVAAPAAMLPGASPQAAALSEPDARSRANSEPRPGIGVLPQASCKQPQTALAPPVLHREPCLQAHGTPAAARSSSPPVRGRVVHHSPGSSSSRKSPAGDASPEIGRCPVVVPVSVMAGGGPSTLTQPSPNLTTSPSFHAAMEERNHLLSENRELHDRNVALQEEYAEMRKLRQQETVQRQVPSLPAQPKPVLPLAAVPAVQLPQQVSPTLKAGPGTNGACVVGSVPFGATTAQGSTTSSTCTAVDMASTWPNRQQRMSVHMPAELAKVFDGVQQRLAGQCSEAVTMQYEPRPPL